jgi:serine protease Do
MKTKPFAPVFGVVLLTLSLLALPSDGSTSPRYKEGMAPDSCSLYSVEQSPVSAAQDNFEISGLDPQEVERMQRDVQEELAKAQAEIARAMVELHQHGAARREKLSAELAARREELLVALQQQQARLLAAKQELAARVGQEAARAMKLAERSFDQEVLFGDSTSGWLGVSIAEVNADKVKELKLPAERGVLITEVEPDSPAAKAGLKVNDVITEFNGQRVESTAQFRRLVRETLSGRTVQLGVWREARSQTFSVTLGNRRDAAEPAVRVFGPRDFNFEFTLPRILTMSRTPVLGINAEDLSGQLGNYFGAPGGEGILVREVNTGSPAEKAGMKAGDVITKIDGERVRTLSDLREKLRAKRDQKSVSVGVIRKGSEVSLNVEIEQPRPPERRPIARRIAL